MTGGPGSGRSSRPQSRRGQGQLHRPDRRGKASNRQVRIARCALHALELGGSPPRSSWTTCRPEESGTILSGTTHAAERPGSAACCNPGDRAPAPARRRSHDAIAAAMAAEDPCRPFRRSIDADGSTGHGAPARARRKVHRGRQRRGRRPGDWRRAVEPSQPVAISSSPRLLLANVGNDMKIAREEIFGLVLSLIPCEDEDDAIRIANESNSWPQRLGADSRPRHGLARGPTGTLRQCRQNGLRTDFSLPFGGYKQSGIGREGGPQALMHYIETKTIMLDGTPSALLEEADKPPFSRGCVLGGAIDAKKGARMRTSATGHLADLRGDRRPGPGKGRQADSAGVISRSRSSAHATRSPSISAPTVATTMPISTRPTAPSARPRNGAIPGVSGPGAGRASQ